MTSRDFCETAQKNRSANLSDAVTPVDSTKYANEPVQSLTRADKEELMTFSTDKS